MGTATTTATEDRRNVLIAHDFAEAYGGAERIIASVAEVLPDAQFWAILGRDSVAERMGLEGRFHSVMPQRAALLRAYRALAPVYPTLVRHYKLPEADVLLTSSYGFAHGFETRNRAPQACYCYSPLRFAWSMTEAYGQALALPLARHALKAFAAYMRAVDRRASQRVTRYIAESAYVAAQIRNAYGVDSEVVMPPVDCSRFVPSPEPGHDDFFLFCGRLVEPYKRPTLTVEAFRGLSQRLVIAGGGPELERLRRIAPPNVEFRGELGDDELVALMQRCTAAVFPSKDDFGLIPVEAMACGRPVIAFAGGGALETVVAGETGEFFDQQSAAALRRAVTRFDPDQYDSGAIRKHAEKWDVPRFQASILEIIGEVAAAG
jgi:glycosyltransferase involved in cell wall biosynthesis